MRLTLVLLLFALLPIVLVGQDSIKTTFKVVSLPQSTPQDASIYIAGDFAGWYPDVKSNKLQRADDGTFVITITHTHKHFLYKFTRGTWESVEGRANGRARSNREFVDDGTHQVLEIAIENWEDISMRTYMLYMYGLFIIGAQGILLVFGVYSLGRSKNNTILSVLLVLVAFSLFGRASTFDPRIFNFQPKLILLPEIILFTYAPLLYLYFSRLAQLNISIVKRTLFFAPAAVQLIIYFPYLLKANQTFVYLMIDNKLHKVFALSGAIALVFSLFFWVAIGRLIPGVRAGIKTSRLCPGHLAFLRAIHSTSLILLVLWLGVLIIYAWGVFKDRGSIPTAEAMIDILWLLFSSTIFYITYFVIKHPEIFRSKKKYESAQVDSGEHETIKRKLDDLLNDQKIFKDSELTLASLSYKIPTTPHVLSRIINESYQCTFSTLINRYRIEEFIKLAKERAEDSYLSIAYEVGFQSKATFNRAFKKEKETNPRAYFLLKNSYL